MAAKIQLRRDTTANWEAAEPVLSEGEIGFDTTTDQFKIGDGTSTWSELSYYAGTGGGGGDATTTPTLSLASSANELSTIDVTVTNYDATIVYDVTVTGGSINTSSHPWQWTLPAVTADTVYKITITAQELGKTASAKIQTITVVAVNTTADGVISVPSHHRTPENLNITVAKQSATEDDWAEASPTVFVKEDIKLPISGSTSTTLKSTQYIDSGTNLILEKSDGSYAEIKNASVTFSNNEIASTSLEEVTVVWDEGTSDASAINASQNPQNVSRRYKLRDGTYCTVSSPNSGAYTLSLVKHNADGSYLSDVTHESEINNVAAMMINSGVYEDILYMSYQSGNTLYCFAVDMNTLDVVSKVRYVNNTTWTVGRAWFNGESWIFNDATYVHVNGTLFGYVLLQDATANWTALSGVYIIDAVSLGSTHWMLFTTNGTSVMYTYVVMGNIIHNVGVSSSDSFVDVSNMAYTNASFADHSPTDYFHVYAEKGLSYSIRDDMLVKITVPHSVLNFPYTSIIAAAALRDSLASLEDQAVMKSYESGVSTTIYGFFFETNTRNIYLISGANVEVVDHDLNALSTGTTLTNSTSIDYGANAIGGHIYTDSDGYLYILNSVSGDRTDKIKTDKMKRYPSTFEVDLTSLSLSAAPTNAYINPVKKFNIYASPTKVEPQYKPFVPTSDWDGVANTVRSYPSSELDLTNLYAYATDGTREKMTNVTSTEVALTIDDTLAHNTHGNWKTATTGGGTYGWQWLLPQPNTDVVLIQHTAGYLYINRYNSSGTEEYTTNYDVNLTLLAPSGYTAADANTINCLQVADDKIVIVMSPSALSRYHIFTYDPTTDTVDDTGVIVHTDAENTGSNAETLGVYPYFRYGKLYVLNFQIGYTGKLTEFDPDTLAVTDTYLIDATHSLWAPNSSTYGAPSLYNVVAGNAIFGQDTYYDANFERTQIVNTDAQTVGMSNHGLGYASGVDGITYVNDENEHFVYYVDHGTPYGAGLIKYGADGEPLWTITRSAPGSSDVAGVQPLFLQLQPDLYLISVPSSYSNMNYIIFEDNGDSYTIHYDKTLYPFTTYTTAHGAFIKHDATSIIWMDTNNDIAYTTTVNVKDNYYTKAYDLSYDALSLTPATIRQEVTPTTTPDVTGVTRKIDETHEITFEPYTTAFREIETDIAYTKHDCQLVIELNKEVS